uniref:Isopropyl malate synthase htyA n=1 Tax=Aspergillus pachycristata (strain ATCC 58397 / KCTC 6058 / NRRL 11440 / A42355) TaxID=590939 RepID=HTYA_ASPP1|nr:RecName: Full=Isopropyl malate synthase htyA; AltName: Full=L-homotyrosine biosynthetic cluster protein A [Aspergillus rugulosus]AFT91393.1 HtyA [Aspergillus rugulosus]
MSTICAGGQTLESKYGGRAPPQIQLPDRQWPSKKLTESPIWLSTDLRDGNQALPNPMTTSQKWQMFRLLVDIGFKQIEVSFPCASDTEYTFTRALVETPGAVPDDVSLEVMTPCRKETLVRAVESLKGAKKAILFTYLATSDNYRETILQRSEAETLEHVRDCIEYARAITKEDPEARQTEWSLGFGMEDFANARPDAALRLAEVIQAAWQPSRENPVILGLASSVEAATVNIFADQVEYFSRHLSSRETVCISIHTHNDRGGAAAAAELACLAGGDRVEGCLFGNGERAGNLDLVTAAMNCFTQGMETGLDFSNLPEIRRVYESITQLPVHPRTPYSGDYYFRAFSGAHQDAIRKGLQKRAANSSKSPWKVPYLPLDPADLGVSFDNVIGVNSQSGKGGVAWLIQNGLALSIPTQLAASFSHVVKEQSVAQERGLAAEEICALFADRYDLRDSPSGRVVREHGYIAAFQHPGCALELEDVTEQAARAAGILTRGLDFLLRCTRAASHPLGGPDDSNLTVAFVQCAVTEKAEEAWGIGIGFSQDSAIDRALLSVMNRHYQPTPIRAPLATNDSVIPRPEPIRGG